MSIIEQIRTFVQDRLEENKRLSKNNYIFAHNQSEDEIFLRYLDTLKEQPVCEDLKEAAYKKVREMFGNDMVDYDGHSLVDASKAAKIFIAGASWQKEQMMKEAVEGEVEKCYVDECGVHTCVSLGSGYTPGTRMKLIIVKEEGK